jgi:ABC-type polysaccharide/polyol phosphate transport system ATPase subunit
LHGWVFGGSKKQEKDLQMSSDVAISIKGVSKAYQIYDRPHDRLKQMIFGSHRKYHEEFWALRDVDFEVKKGETVGIVGRNGSGKSTLLQIICGTVTPSSGSVEKTGRVSALLELGSGFNPEFTGRENVYLNGTILGLNKTEIDSRFDKIAAFADIGNFLDSPVKHYSSGMFARLAFSVAIHVDPDILIVDEILAVGDAAFQRRCLAKFYEIREDGCSILFVSHDQYQVKSVCQRALYLDQGHQKMFGAAGRVIDQYVIDTEKAVAQFQSAALISSESEAVLEATACKKGDVEINDATQKNDSAEKQQVNELPEKVELGALYRITDVALLDDALLPIFEVVSGQNLYLRLRFQATSKTIPPKISFVFNLYKHDDFYICGSTSIMDGLAAYPAGRSGEVLIKFPAIPLLGGLYKWRVAINDDGGFIVHAEAKDVCEFQVIDNFNAVGLVNLPREWQLVKIE